jgi:hypothetical protein
MSCVVFAFLTLCAGLAGVLIGLNLADNPPKRTRKTRKPKTLSNEAIGETK